MVLVKSSGEWELNRSSARQEEASAWAVHRTIEEPSQTKLRMASARWEDGKDWAALTSVYNNGFFFEGKDF